MSVAFEARLRGLRSTAKVRAVVMLQRERPVNRILANALIKFAVCGNLRVPH